MCWEPSRIFQHKVKARVTQPLDPLHLPTACNSFAPIIGHQPRTLILGSMPGVASLDAAQYYAHPRNRFWPLVAQILALELPPTYEARLDMLCRHGIALWDVLAQCERPGSLDSSIRAASQEPNAIPTLLAQHTSIQSILCNGRHAYTALQKFFPDLKVAVLALPSTSPANARWSFERLLGEWRAALKPPPA